MAKFKKGDVLVPKSYYRGFEKLTIDWIDKKFYHCKIINGSVTILIHSLEENYELKKD